MLAYMQKKLYLCSRIMCFIMKKVIILFFTAIVLFGCNGRETTRVSATGTIYECLVVGNNAAYELVQPVMEADMPTMPQVESFFTLSHVAMDKFDDFLKPTRNILIIDINPQKYTVVKAKYSRDYWSRPQAVWRVNAPDNEAFAEYWKVNGEKVRAWFVNEELNRQAMFYRASTNKEARKTLCKSAGCDMWIPEDYMLIKDTAYNDTTFLWCCNNKGPMRRDVVIYTYPYTDFETFTLPYLNAKRDAVLGRFVSATLPGTYMGTEYKVIPPELRILGLGDVPQVAVDSTLSGAFWGAEVRGLWKMQGGEAMGGPYISISRIDPIRARVITAETFIFAPGQKKRNATRQAEAVLYTLSINH